MNKKIDYAQAFAQLEEIVQQLEEGTVPLEELHAQVKKANMLIAYCEVKLHGLQEQVQQQFNEEEE